jgi:hypothetical protein
MLAVRQTTGMSALATERLNNSVRYVIPLVRRYFRWRDERPSGPTAEEFDNFSMADLVNTRVKRLNS